MAVTKVVDYGRESLRRDRVGRGARGRSRGVGVALVWLTVSACAGGEQPAEVVEVVEPTTPVWTPGTGWRVEPDPEVEIGVFSGDEHDQFSDVVAGAVQSDGDLVVVDAPSAEVRLFSGQGEYRATLGGPGDGPGEFRAPTQLRITSDEGILVWDDRHWRVTEFDPEGAFTAVRSVGLAEVSAGIAPPLYAASGTLLAGESVLVRLVEKAQTKGGKSSPRGEAPDREPGGAALYPADGGDVRILGRFPGTQTTTVEAPWGPFQIEPPFAARTSFAAHPRAAAFCIGPQEDSSVLCVDEEGAERTIRWSANRVPTAQDSRAVARWRDRMHRDLGAKLTADQIDGLLDDVPVPTSLPPYSGLHLDSDGYLWVARTSSADEGTDFWVFDGETLLGNVSVPLWRVLEIGSGHVLGVVLDDADVQYVRLHRLDRSSPRP